MIRFVASVACLALAAGAEATPRPRILSMNPCVDAVLVRVADPDQIVGISHYSQDPDATSIPLDLARRFHATSGTAEEIVAVLPDRVIAGPHVSPSTIHVLERMNINLTKLRVPETVAASEQEIREIAAVVGAPERGEALVAEIERAIAAARPRGDKQLSAVIWQGGGMVPGGGSLADELLRLTGFRNASVSYGLKKWDVLPLEYLVASPPDVVLSVGTGEAGRDRMLGHPVVRKLATHVAFRTYPFRLLSCGGPTIIEAVGHLAAIRRELGAP